MIHRCENPKADRFDSYGGRGISVCTRWRNSFEAFLADMGPRPENCTIDRIDVNGNYEPGNCRWVPAHIQSRNKTTARIITLNGQSLSLIEWSEHLNIPYSRIRARSQLGFPAEAILSTLTGQAFRLAFPRSTNERIGTR
jgi:hypothetical protein